MKKPKKQKVRNFYRLVGHLNCTCSNGKLCSGKLFENDLTKQEFSLEEANLIHNQLLRIEKDITFKVEHCQEVTAIK